MERSEAQLQAQFEEEQHILRRMRMCLREVCNRLLRENSLNVFHYPVTEEEAPDYNTIVQTPMDVSTLLQHTDNGQYLTRAAFMQDLELIALNAKAHAMLSQIDKDLVAQCEAILARGGPLKLDMKQNGTELAGSFNLLMVQPSSATTRATARLRCVQPEINVSQTAEVHVRRSRRNSDGDVGGETEVGVSMQTHVETSIDLNIDLAEKTVEYSYSVSLTLPSIVNMEVDGQKESSLLPTTGSEKEQQRSATLLTNDADHGPVPSSPDLGGKDQMDFCYQETSAMDPDHPMAAVPASYIEKLKKRFVKRTQGFGVSDLEMLHAKFCQEVRSDCTSKSRTWVIKLLKRFLADMKSRKHIDS